MIFQNVFIDTAVNWIKKLDDIEKVKSPNILKSLVYADYGPTAGEAKSGRYKFNRENLNVDVE